jgi:type I restriction enzyme S subunit
VKDGWQTLKLCDVCDVDKSQGIHEARPYVGLEDIESQTGRFVGSTQPRSVKSSTFKFSRDHVLYGRLRPYLNKVMLPEFVGHCSTEIFPLKPRPGLSREFLKYWLLRQATVDLINATSTGTRMPRANMAAVLDLKFPLVPPREQERIVGILDEALAGIATARENAEKNLRNARAFFDSYVDSVFGQRAQGWTTRRLSEAVDATCALSYGIVQPGEECPNGLPVVRPTDLTTKTVSAAGLKRIDPNRAESYQRTRLHGGELLLCVRGSTGVVSVASSELVGANVTRGIVPVRFDSAAISQEFGYYLLRSGVVQRQVRDKTYGAALMQINIRDLRGINVCYPSLKDQATLAARLDEASAATERIEAICQRKLVALDELKKSLLHQAFTGQL